jgi:chromosomal replication initiator protein
LIRLLAVASLSGQEVNDHLAEEVLKDLLGSGSKITKQIILKNVIEEFGFSEAELRGKKRTQKLALARQTSMFLIRTMLNLSLAEIGEFFGGKDHSTVIHAIDKVEGLKKTDIEYLQRLERITNWISG